MFRDDFSKTLYLSAVDPTGGSGLTWCPAFNALGMAGLSISIRVASGTVNGQFQVQSADFGDDPNHLPAAGDWVNYPGAVYPASAGSVTGTLQIQITDFRSKWVRVIFTDSASASPKVDMAITARAWS